MLSHLCVLSYFSGMKDKQQISAGKHQKDEREWGNIMPMAMTPKEEKSCAMRRRLIKAA